MPTIAAKPPYIRRNSIPNTYEREWLATEFQNIQRGIPSQAIRTALTDYTPSANDFTLAVDASVGPVTITLRPPDQVLGLFLNIKKVDASGNAVTIAGVVDGVTNPILTSQYDGITIQSDGTQYLQLGTF